MIKNIWSLILDGITIVVLIAVLISFFIVTYGLSSIILKHPLVLVGIAFAGLLLVIIGHMGRKIINDNRKLW